MNTNVLAEEAYGVANLGQGEEFLSDDGRVKVVVAHEQHLSGMGTQYVGGVHVHKEYADEHKTVWSIAPSSSERRKRGYYSFSELLKTQIGKDAVTIVGLVRYHNKYGGGRRYITIVFTQTAFYRVRGVPVRALSAAQAQSRAIRTLIAGGDNPLGQKEALWGRWKRNMGKYTSESDLSIARSWFEELWQAGYNSQGIPVARPLDYMERQAYELGIKAGRSNPLGARRPRPKEGEKMEEKEAREYYDEPHPDLVYEEWVEGDWKGEGEMMTFPYKWSQMLTGPHAGQWVPQKD